MRLVLIEKNKYTVYENKQCIAIFELDEADPNCRPLTAEEVEKLRVDNYSKA
jgi:hypothetical protein